MMQLKVHELESILENMETIVESSNGAMRHNIVEYLIEKLCEYVYLYFPLLTIQQGIISRAIFIREMKHASDELNHTQMSNFYHLYKQVARYLTTLDKLMVLDMCETLPTPLDYSLIKHSNLDEYDIAEVLAAYTNYCFEGMLIHLDCELSLSQDINTRHFAYLINGRELDYMTTMVNARIDELMRDNIRDDINVFQTEINYCRDCFVKHVFDGDLLALNEKLLRDDFTTPNGETFDLLHDDSFQFESYAGQSIDLRGEICNMCGNELVPAHSEVYETEVIYVQGHFIHKHSIYELENIDELNSETSFN